MATGRPWYQRNAADFILGTSHLDLETRGAYSLIIDLLNDRDCPIPDEPRYLARMMNITVQRWKRIRETLLAEDKLTLTADGRLTNPRFERERHQRTVEQRRSVEAGRLGGLKSAARRAGRHSGKPVDDSNPPLPFGEPGDTKTSQKLRKNLASFSEITDVVTDEKPASQADFAEPPPQANARAKSPEIESTKQTITQSLKSCAIPQTPDSAVRSIGPDRDLMALLERCSRASGYHPSHPGAIAKAVDLVKGWRDAGIDFDTIVIPCIERLTASTGDPTSSLARFDKRIRHEHARLAASASTGPPPTPAEPILEPPDEDRSLRPLRAELLRAVGPAAYALAFNSVRFERVGAAALGANPLRVCGPSWLTEEVVNGSRSATLRKLARDHGFDKVWTGPAQLTKRKETTA